MALAGQVVNSIQSKMEIKSISKALSLYYGYVKETVYVTKVDENNKEFVQQIVYLRSGKLEPVKGSSIDMLV